MSTTRQKSCYRRCESPSLTQNILFGPGLTTVPRPFIKSQLFGLLRCYIVVDLIGHYVRASTYGQGVGAPPLLSDSFSHQILFGWLGAIRSYFDMASGYHLISLLGVGLGLTEPALWPPMFGSFTEAYTMRKLWGEQ
jgi:hypothetical protein